MLSLNRITVLTLATLAAAGADALFAALDALPVECDVSLLQTDTEITTLERELPRHKVAGEGIARPPPLPFSVSYLKAPTLPKFTDNFLLNLYKWMLGRRVDVVTLMQDQIKINVEPETSPLIIEEVSEDADDLSTVKVTYEENKGNIKEIRSKASKPQGLVKLVLIIVGFIITCVWCTYGCPPKCGDDKDEKSSTDETETRNPKYMPTPEREVDNVESPRKRQMHNSEESQMQNSEDNANLRNQ